MSRKGKKFAAAFGLVDRTKLYDLEEAIALSQKAAFAKFDESVDAAVKLGVQVKLFVLQYLQKAKRLRKLKQPAQKLLAAMN